VDKETFSTVLGLLGPDAEQAADEYRRLHERLARFFSWNNAVDPEALADEALDRLLSRLADQRVGQHVDQRVGQHGGESAVQSAPAFALGIARHMLQEESRRQQKISEAGRQWSAHTGGADSEEAERMDEALAHSMARLRPDRRALIEAYYLFSGSLKIRAHRKLAEENGLTLNALRNRAMRARQELESAIRAYLDGKIR